MSERKPNTHSPTTDVFMGGLAGLIVGGAEGLIEGTKAFSEAFFVSSLEGTIGGISVYQSEKVIRNKNNTGKEGTSSLTRVGRIAVQVFTAVGCGAISGALVPGDSRLNMVMGVANVVSGNIACRVGRRMNPPPEQ